MFAFHQLVCKLFIVLLIGLAGMHWNHFNVMAALALRYVCALLSLLATNKHASCA